MGIYLEVVFKAAAELGEELGETRRFRFGQGMTIGYSPEQQEMILAFLEAKGLFAPDAPEGYLSERGMGDTYCKGNRQPVRRAIAELGAALGETRRFRFGSKITIGYSPEQVEMIVQRARILSKSVGDIKQS
ncbi:MAG: hypothetical protein EOT04_03200 [Candidatus Chaera renei]|uniref:Uncharacterized protein n=1 Tax=Candidatus Chaera renei TaxID=2506947 RepID=A0A4Q0AHK8_9BACT|nr:MAG: hypothetical protein EOT04_03200 [Candidatus Chaera renei]